jgi:hypothetical protein
MHIHGNNWAVSYRAYDVQVEVNGSMNVYVTSPLNDRK